MLVELYALTEEAGGLGQDSASLGQFPEGPAWLEGGVWVAEVSRRRRSNKSGLTDFLIPISPIAPFAHVSLGVTSSVAAKQDKV